MNYLQKELYALIQSESEIFEFLQSGSLDGIWYWDLEEPEYEWMSPSFWQLFGYDPDEKEHLASEWQDMINPDDLQLALDNFNKHCADPNHPYDQVVRYLHKDGSTVWVRCRGIAIRDENGKPVRMLGAHNDLTQQMNQERVIKKQNKELKKAQKKLIKLSITDELTGVHNRRYFQEQIEFFSKSASRNNTSISLIIFDIDYFKAYNDSFGHPAGDKVLITIGKILKVTTRETDIITRIGGEEFAIILPVSNKVESIKACIRLHKAFEEFNWPERMVSASFGIGTLSPEECKEVGCWDRLHSMADKALYYSKENGRNQINHIDDITLSSQKS